MKSLVEKFGEHTKTRDEAIALIENFDRDFRKGNSLLPVAVCFSLDELRKLLSHASVAMDIANVDETERGIAFYFVAPPTGGEASILMSIGQMKDVNNNGRFGTDIAEFNDEIVTKGFIKNLASGIFNLLDVGTKHP